eukprot:3793944-Pleurochrysis_carterae.AAC.2
MIEGEFEQKNSMTEEVTAKSDQEQADQEPFVPVVDLADNECVLAACAWRTCALRAYMRDACALRASVLDACALRACVLDA